MKQILFVASSIAVSTIVLLTGCGNSGEPQRTYPQAHAKPKSRVEPEHRHPHSKRHERRRPHRSPEAIPGAQRVPEGENPYANEPATPVPTYTKEQLSADIANLTRTEHAMQAVGLKIELAVAQNGSKEVNWDYKFMDDFKGDIFQSIPALKNFSKVGREFLTKYDKEFVVTGRPDAATVMARSTIPVLTAKLILVERSIEMLERQQAGR